MTPWSEKAKKAKLKNGTQSLERSHCIMTPEGLKDTISSYSVGTPVMQGRYAKDKLLNTSGTAGRRSY